MAAHSSDGVSLPEPLAGLLAHIAPAAITSADRSRLAARWTSLRERGFEITPRRDSLEIRHARRAFETVVHLSDPDDLGERRQVFRALRSAFGTWAERWLPWLVQPSPSIAGTYRDIKEIVEICQSLRRPPGDARRRN